MGRLRILFIHFRRRRFFNGRSEKYLNDHAEQQRCVPGHHAIEEHEPNLCPVSIAISPRLLLLDDKLHPVLTPDRVVEPAEVVASQIPLIVARIEMIGYVENLDSDFETIFLFEASGR